MRTNTGHSAVWRVGDGASSGFISEKRLREGGEREQGREREGERERRRAGRGGGELFPESVGQVFPFLSFWRKSGGVLYYCQS